jgi:hypothetical protein
VHAVRFGGTAATFRRVSSTEIRAMTPAHPAGLVAVAVVTASGRGSAKDKFDYATKASGPIGAGYRVLSSAATAGRLRLHVPTLTCAPHETSGLGAAVQSVERLNAGDRRVASVAFRCVDGVASYHSFMNCGGGGSGGFAGPRPRPGDVVILGFDKNSSGIEIDHATGGGTGSACLSGGRHPTNDLGAAFLVRTASVPPSSLQSLTVEALVGDAALAAAHPTRQSQRLTATTVLRPGPIGADGKSFTVRVQPR